MHDIKIQSSNKYTLFIILDLKLFFSNTLKLKVLYGATLSHFQMWNVILFLCTRAITKKNRVLFNSGNGIIPNSEGIIYIYIYVY